MNRYVSFSPYFSGWSNIVMSYELFLSIAHITKRTAILPPKVWSLFLSKDRNNKETFIDIWDIFDKQKIQSMFDVVDFYDVKEIADHANLIESNTSYTGNIETYIDDLYNVKFPKFTNEERLLALICDNHTVLYNDSVDDFDDFLIFNENRPLLNLNSDVKFLHFENNLFGHFWYHVYAGSKLKNIELKKKINTALRYQDKFYMLAKKVFDMLGNYSSIHIRRGKDFLSMQNHWISDVNTSDKLLNAVKRLVRNNKPLYIATDEKDLSFFDDLKKHYNVFFFDDFNYDVDVLNRTILEQVICAESDFFIGTFGSTYTKRINVMRGIEGKSAFDEFGYNKINSFSLNKVNSYPWVNRKYKRFFWYDSSRFQYGY